MNKILVMGDIHGDFRPVRDLHLRLSDNEEYNEVNKTLILLGDSGANYYLDGPDGRDASFKKKLGRYPFEYFVIRGNHEERPGICMKKNLNDWHMEKYFDNWVYVENNFPYIKYALDGVAMYNIPCDIDYMMPEDPLDDDIEVVKTYKTLVVPGAYSVDKYYRLQRGWSWFSMEQLTEEEQLEGLEIIKSEEWKCDLVLSHTCPIIYEPTDLFLSSVDQSMVDKSMERYLGEIEKKLDYKALLFGHYHAFRNYPREDGRYRAMLFNDAAIDLEEYMNGEINKL